MRIQVHLQWQHDMVSPLVSAVIFCVLAMCFAIATVSSVMGQAATPSYSVEEVLEQLAQSQEAIANVTIECTWISQQLDGKTTWEDQEFIWDSFGRRRIISRSGPLSSDGVKQPDTREHTDDTIFDGEVVAYSQEFPHLTRIGDLPKPGEKTGYNSVIIGDATSGLRTDLQSQRNAFEYCRNAAIPTIKDGVKLGTVIVSAPDAQGNNIEVEINYDGKEHNGAARVVIAIATKHQWQIESMRSFSKGGSLVSQIAFEHQQQGDGLWVPTKGRHTIWGDRSKSDKPVLDWQVQVKNAVFNAPKFKDSVFKISLKPDAAVSDTRYHVTYRVGDEGLTTSELARHAAKAREAMAEAKAKLRRALVSPDEAVGMSKWRWFFLILNVVVVVTIAVIYARLLWRRRASIR